MGSLTPLIKAAGRGGDEALQKAKASVRIGGRVGADEVVGQSDIDEMLAGLSALDEADGGDMVRQEVTAKELSQRESERVKAISDPSVEDIEYRFQATSPDEYKTRVQKQLYDPDYAARVVNIDASALGGSGIRNTHVEFANEQDALFQARIKGPLYKDKRYKARVKAATADSPYEDRVFVHMEQQTSPDGTLPQFGDDPNEMGLHSGTYNASVEATFRSQEGLMETHKRMQREMEELALPAGMSVKQVEKEIAPVLEDYFIAKFRENDFAANNVWTDVSNKLAERFKENGYPEVEVAAFIARLKRIPTPSATPHYFTGKNGLHLSDAQGNWSTVSVVQQLERTFPDKKFEIDEIVSSTSHGERTREIQKFIEEQGYDHIVYHNQAEDIGTVSIINWNEDLMVSVYDPKVTGGNTTSGAQAMTAFVMGGAGMGSAELRNEE